jgi:hypothetical protein
MFAAKRPAKTTSSDTPSKCEDFSVLSLQIKTTLHIINFVAIGLEYRAIAKLVWPGA